MNEFDRQLRKFAKAANATPEEIARVSEAARHVTETVTLQTYSLQIIGPNDGQELAAIQSAVKVRSMMREAEENLTDLLPEGYSVSIKEWDAEEETPR